MGTTGLGWWEGNVRGKLFAAYRRVRLATHIPNFAQKANCRLMATGNGDEHRKPSLLRLCREHGFGQGRFAFDFVLPVLPSALQVKCVAVGGLDIQMRGNSRDGSGQKFSSPARPASTENLARVPAGTHGCPRRISFACPDQPAQFFFGNF